MTRLKTLSPRTPRRVPVPAGARIRDWMQDWLAAHSEPSALPQVPAYLVGLDHRWQENDIWLRTQVRDQMREHVLARQVLSQQLAALPTPTPARAPVDLDLVHPGEVHLPAADVRARRQGEQDAQDLAHQRQVDADRQHRQTLQAEIYRHTAAIEEAWALAVALVARVRHYYQQRAARYCRILHRRGIPMAVPVLSQSTWASEPCPWTNEPALYPPMELTA